MPKTANLYVRIEPEVKEQAEKILDELGISASSAIAMYYKQIILQRGLPFEVSLPKTPASIDMTRMTDEEIHEKLEIGYQDAVEGRTRDAKKVFAEFRSEKE